MDNDRAPSEHAFQQIHIDAARNATDDFNPFHDPRKCTLIPGNPFRGPIVLGFQLECLIEYLVRRFREEERQGDPWVPAFRNYQFTFADALLPGDPFSVMIKPTRTVEDPSGEPSRSNRVAIRKPGGLVLLGQVRDTMAPLALVDEPLPEIDLRTLHDRSLLPDRHWFHKRKFLMNSNAKNMLSGSLADQAYFFDELEDRIRFPDLFPVSLISCALLERAHATGHDFYANPMVYTRHHISVDQRLARSLLSNTAVHLLMRTTEPGAAERAGGLGQTKVAPLRHHCFGLLSGQRVLFRAEVALAPLEALRFASQPRSIPTVGP